MGQENHFRRGDIFFVYLDPCFGREIGGYKTRPVVVLSIEAIHQSTRIVAVVPGTTSDRISANVVAVDPDKGNGLSSRTYFQCHQIRAIDQGRMTGRASGLLAEGNFRRIEDAVWTILGAP